jgi:hypothetical protein
MSNSNLDEDADRSAGSDRRENSYQLQSRKATRKSRRPKKPPMPGGIRQRRNKHWSW